eukprot:tig00000950_g5763.t1
MDPYRTPRQPQYDAYGPAQDPYGERPELEEYGGDPYQGRPSRPYISGSYSWRMLATLSQLIEDADLASDWYFSIWLYMTYGTGYSYFGASLAFTLAASTVYMLKFFTALFQRRLDIAFACIPAVGPFVILHSDPKRVGEIRRLRAIFTLVLKVPLARRRLGALGPTCPGLARAFTTGIYLFTVNSSTSVGIASFVITLTAFVVGVNESLHLILSQRGSLTAEL